MLKDSSRFVFAEGCPHCNYRYEREAGYFTGASWLICFPLISLLAFLSVAGLMLATDFTVVSVIALGSIFSLLLSIASFPYCMAVWMYFEHSFRPLQKDDELVPVGDQK